MDDQSDDQLLKELEVRPARYVVLKLRQGGRGGGGGGGGG